MADRPADITPWQAYKTVWKRRRLLWRAFRSRHKLSRQPGPLPPRARDAILAFTCLRNELARLPHFLDYYRRLGVTHFLIVDNDSDDGSAAFLAKQPDVSVWHTTASYRAARFGLDWINWLQSRYGHGRWCLHVDADELLVYAHHDSADLHALTAWLDRENRQLFGTLMLELYPDASLGSGPMPKDPLDLLTHYDPGPYRAQRQRPMSNLWVQGGVRERMFFADDRSRSPTLNKLPLVKWNRRWVYVNSTHSMLPRRLNMAYDGPGGHTPSGVLLHTKFLPEVVDKSKEDLVRGQHFHDPVRFRPYYDALIEGPSLMSETSERYTGWNGLMHHNLLHPGNFEGKKPGQVGNNPKN